MTDPTTQLADAIAARAEHARLTARIADARKRRQDAAALVDARRSSLADETADVARLESFSPTRIWLGLTGGHTDRLEKEKAEQQAAAYDVATAQHGLELADAEVRRLEAELSALGHVEAAYDEAVAAKEAWLRESGGPEGSELADLAERVGHVRAQQKEVDEARAAASTARNALDAATRTLESAGGWATYDTFFGGGLIADSIKHSRIDQAAVQLGEVNAAFKVLSSELADVDLPAVDGVHMSRTDVALDMWFDNFFSDMAARNRIKDAGARVAEADSRLRDVEASLARRAEELEAEATTIEGRRRDLVGG